MVAKSIFFKLVLKGRGIVNFDSNDQKYYWNQQKNISYVQHNNVSFGKGNYKKEGDNLKKILKISSDCLRHAIHIEGHPFHTVNILQDEKSRINYLAHIDTLLRGYMLTDTMEKKKSSYTLTSAENISESVSSIEAHSKSGAKVSKENEDDTSDNSFFFKESIGDTVYSANGAISIKDLRFISLDDKFDRRAVKNDSAKEYIKCLSKTLGSQVNEPSYYVITNSAYQIPEYGILLTDDQIRFLLENLFNKLACISIGKSQTGYALVDKVEFKVVENPILDKMDDSNWKTSLDLSSMTFDNPYSEVDVDLAVEQEKNIRELKAQAKEEKDTIKKEKKDNKEKAKSKHTK